MNNKKDFDAYKIVKQRRVPEYHERVVIDKTKKADTNRVDWRLELENGQ
jgi:hypothetical protein